MSRDLLKKVSGCFLAVVFISIPLRDEVADGLGAGAYDFRDIAALEKRAVARVEVQHAYGMLAGSIQDGHGHRRIAPRSKPASLRRGIAPFMHQLFTAAVPATRIGGPLNRTSLDPPLLPEALLPRSGEMICVHGEPRLRGAGLGAIVGSDFVGRPGFGVPGRVYRTKRNALTLGQTFRSDSGQQKTRAVVAGAGFSDRLGTDPRSESGAGERNRTLDLLITSELLYQLSYTGAACRGTRRVCIVMKKMQALRGRLYLTMVRRGRLGSSSPPSSPEGASASEPSGAAGAVAPWAPASGGS